MHLCRPVPLFPQVHIDKIERNKITAELIDTKNNIASIHMNKVKIMVSKESKILARNLMNLFKRIIKIQRTQFEKLITKTTQELTEANIVRATKF